MHSTLCPSLTKASRNYRWYLSVAHQPHRMDHREGGMFARRATFVLSALALAPSLSSPREVPQVSADTLVLYHHMPGPGSPCHKCETKDSCKSTHHCLPHPYYMTKLPQQVYQNWPGCLVKGGGGAGTGGEWLKKDAGCAPVGLTLPPTQCPPPSDLAVQQVTPQLKKQESLCLANSTAKLI